MEWDGGGEEGAVQAVPEGHLGVYAAAAAGEGGPQVRRVVGEGMEGRQLEDRARRQQGGEVHRRMAAASPGDILQARVATRLYPCPYPGGSA